MNARVSNLIATSPQPVAHKSDTAKSWGLGFAVFGVLVWGASFAIGFQLALTVLLVTSWVAVVTGLRKPVIGLYGIAMLCALDPLEKRYLLSGGLLRYNSLNYWLLLVIVLTLPFLLRLNDAHSRLLQLFLLLLSLELLISPGPASGLISVMSIVVVFSMIWYFARALDDLGRLYWLGVAIGAMTAAGSLAFFAHQDSLPPINPNSWPYFPLTGLFAICLSFPYTGNHFRSQGLLILLSVFNFVGVFLSASRGCLLIAICCLIFLTVKIPGASRRLVIVVIAILVGLGISIQFTDLVAHTLHRVNKSFDTAYSAANRTSGRSDLMLGAWYIFLDNPFGVGTGGYAHTWANLDYLEGLSGFERGREVEAHSAWAQAISENGIPGILLLAGYVLSFAVVGWRRRKTNLFALGLLTTATFSTAFISTAYQGKALWFLAAGVTTLLHREEILEQLHGAAAREPVMSISGAKVVQHG